jgi:hypothetical protein
VRSSGGVKCGGGASRGAGGGMHDDDGGASRGRRRDLRWRCISTKAVRLEVYGGASFLPSGLRRGVLLHVGGHARSGVGRPTVLFAPARSGTAVVVVAAQWRAAAWWWCPAPARWWWRPGGVRLEVWAWRRR